MSSPSVPNLWTIPASAPFLATLADALISGRLVPGTHQLHDHLVLLPTRRACRALTDLLAERAGDGALLLPRIRPIGDIDESDLLVDSAEFITTGGHTLDIPPSIAPLRRLVLLTELVLHWGRTVARTLMVPGRDEPVAIPVRPGDAALLAGDLARLLDDFETEGRSLSVLSGLVPDDHAAYWQLTLRFLGIATETWPEILEREGAVDPAARRDALLRAESTRLAASPPAGPVIAAGSTGTIPATAGLLSTISRLPFGAVVLPGLDTALEDEAWHAIDSIGAPHPGHPQFGLKKLLARIGAARGDVAALAPTPAPRRERLLSEALRPAGTTEKWASLNARLDETGRAEALDGMSAVVAASEQEEAAAIALILREAIERPGRTAVLVTPDRGLARRVCAELGRWNIALDDSAGVPLAETPPGILFRLVAEAAASRLAPRSIAALTAHPLATFAAAPAKARHAARCLELLALRGPRPAPGARGLVRVVARACAPAPGTRLNPVVARLGDADRTAARNLADAIAAAFAPFETFGETGPVALSDLVDCHREALHRVSATQDGICGACEGAAGRALDDFLDALSEAADGGLAASIEEYPALIGVLMAGHMVRPRVPGHRRLSVLGPLEARLLSSDLVVLGGLNEGAWPADARTDPFLNRPMRTAAGLEAPERFIGLAAHDVAQLMTAPEVVFTRAGRQGGEPTVASRWWQRLEVVAGTAQFARCVERGSRYLQWARELDRSEAQDRPAEPLARPPVAARPGRLSVTEIETLIRDPYAVYARRILGLHALDDIETAPDAATRGSLIHDAMKRFDRKLRQGSTVDPIAELIAIGEDLFREVADFPELVAIWWPRFMRVAGWFAPLDAAERAALADRLTEVSGELPIDLGGTVFTLSGRADRIDVTADGALRIVDYKTGGVPTAPQVQSGLAPQLPLEAAMARLGAFRDIPAGAPVAMLTYIALKGGEPPGAICDIRLKDTTAEALAQATLENLRAMLLRFTDPSVPYRAKTRVEQLRFATEYDHLSRYAEWSSVDGTEG